MAKTKEELQADIKALADAGLDHSEEDAQLKQLVLAKTEAPEVKVKAKALTPAPTEEEDFVPLNTEAYEAGWVGGGWIAPATIGVKDAICDGYFTVKDGSDLHFIFINVPDASEVFRGTLVCGAINAPTGGTAAGKVKDVVDALGVSDRVKIVPGKGISSLAVCKGIGCQVLWDDIVIRQKTERRIQDVMTPGAEAAM